MTSNPSRIGILSRDSSAARCSSFVIAAPRTFSTEPSSPFRAITRCSGRNRPSPSPSSCCSCPSFSASVIFATSELMRASIAACFCWAKQVVERINRQNATSRFFDLMCAPVQRLYPKAGVCRKNGERIHVAVSPPLLKYLDTRFSILEIESYLQFGSSARRMPSAPYRNLTGPQRYCHHRTQNYPNSAD